MKCPKCQTENLSDSAFCEECSAPLEAACPTCGASNRPAAKFCRKCRVPLTAAPAAPDPRSYTPKHLAEKILQSKSALEGERKQVTVLFADVKGSMELAERVDPEEWHRILDRFFQILTDGVHRFEGTVNQYTGDGIMALFGAPIAHEDHAQRACYAALHLRDELHRYADELRRNEGLNFSVRMGVNSGEVVVGRIGDDLRMDYTAQGHTVGLAARMERLAAADQMYVTEHTTALVAGYFELRELGPFRIKGVREPITVFALEGVGALRTRLDRSRQRGFSRFVGRGDELRVLEAALERAERGCGQAVGIVGEAGVGKSRLCYEFLQVCRARGRDVLEAHAVAHGRSIPLLPIIELLRQFFRISERDDDQAAREKIAGRLLLLDDRFREFLPLLFEFLAVPDPARPAPHMDPAARQRQLFALTRQLVQAPPSERDPPVLLIEDLHWLDPASGSFIETMMDAVGEASLLLLWTFRPEYHAGWMSKSTYQQIALAALGPDAVRELVADRLGNDPSLDGLAGRIEARTRGNPFFIEEVIQSLIESGALQGSRGSYRLARPVAEVEVPPAVQALLAARIDRLAEHEKLVLQTAAVIGKNFQERVLARCLDLAEVEIADSLRVLRAAEFVYEEAIYPEVEYAFKHPLTQEVAYRSQLVSRRERSHERVARTVEAMEPAERLGEKAALLAYHWAEAGEKLTAARWRARAARYVYASAPVEALRHWREVRALLHGIPETPETLTLLTQACAEILAASFRVGMAPAEVQEIFEEGCAGARKTGDARAFALLLNGYAVARQVIGDAPGYFQYAGEAARAAEQVDDESFRYALQSNDIIYSHGLVGRLSEAVHLADALLLRAGGNADLGADVYGLSSPGCVQFLRSWFLQYLGRLSEAKEQLDRTIEFVRARGEPELLTWALGVYPTIEEASGEIGPGLRCAAEGVEISERIGSHFSRVYAYLVLSQAQLVRAEPAAALEAVEQALAISRGERTGLEFEALTLARRAEALLDIGQTAAAQACAEEAVACAREHGTPLYEPAALLALTRALLAGEGVSAQEVRRNAAQGLAVAEQIGARVYAPRFRELLAALAQIEGDGAGRDRELREALRGYKEMGATGHAERLARQLSG